MDRQLKSYFLSCLLTWVAQFNFRIAFKALKEKKLSVYPDLKNASTAVFS